MLNQITPGLFTFPPRAFCAAFLSIFFSFPVLAQSDPAPAKDPIIESDGTAKVTRNPDYVDVIVGVSSEAEKASECQAAAMTIMDATISALKALKLPGQELQTGTVDLSPRYQDINGRRDDKIMGYRATITLRVRTTDLTSPAKIIDASLAAGCNRVDGVSFGIKEALEAREEAIALATKAAERKAKVLADALNLKIARVVRASTSADRSYSARYVQAANVFNSTEETGGSGAIEAGQVEITATTIVSFAAAPK
ncbi:MAG: SIMPL domain-containing protein [Phycisphaerales bacterium]